MLIIAIVVQTHNIIKTFQIEKRVQDNIELMQKNQDSLEILIERTEKITDRLKNRLNKREVKDDQSIGVENECPKCGYKWEKHQ